MSEQRSTSLTHIGIDGSAWENERGFGRFTRNLVAALAARNEGFRYTLLLESDPAFPVPDGVETKVVNSDHSMSEASSGKSARAGGHMLGMAMAARSLAPDVFFYPAVYSYYPLPARRPTVVCFHDTIPERFPDLIFPTRMNFRFWQAKCWVAKKLATRVMTVSETSAEDLSEILSIDRSRIDTITEGADPVFHPIDDPERLSACRARIGVAENAPLLVYVGGFNRHKNVIRLIEAMPAILETCPDARLAIVGRITGARFWDNVDELQDTTARDPRLAEAITFTGEIDDDALAELLNTASALVMPSLWEGFGLPALEAMSCGTPVLASDRGSLPEVVGDGGLYFDPEDADALSAQAIRLLSEPGTADALRTAATERARIFSWDRGAELAEASFRRALGRS